MYADAYEQEFFRIRNKPITILEIGVDRGGSLEVWKEFLPRAAVYGIDINPTCAKSKNIFIGDQRDRPFLYDVFHRIGGADIVIDDGSHITSHQQQSLDILFPLLNLGGIYVIEDLYTSYPSPFHSCYVDGISTVDYLKNTLDKLNEGGRSPDTCPIPTTVLSIRFYRGICFFLKKTSRQISQIKLIEPPPTQPPSGLLRRDNALSEDKENSRNKE